MSASSLRTLQGNWWQITTKNEIDNPSRGSQSHFFRWGYFAIAPSFLLVSGESCGAGTFHSAGLLGAAFVRGAAAAGVQDRHELLQLLEGADPKGKVAEAYRSLTKEVMANAERQLKRVAERGR